MGRLINTNLTRLDVIRYSKLFNANYNKFLIKNSIFLLFALKMVCNMFISKNFLWKKGLKIANYNLEVTQNYINVNFLIYLKNSKMFDLHLRTSGISNTFLKILNIIFNKMFVQFSKRILNWYRIRPLVNINMQWFDPSKLTSEFVNLHMEAFLKNNKGNPLRILKRFVRNLSLWLKLEFITGFLIIMKGRFGKRLRASKEVFNKGITSFNRFSTLLDYNKKVIFTRYGNYSIKTWLVKPRTYYLVPNYEKTMNSLLSLYYFFITSGYLKTNKNNKALFNIITNRTFVDKTIDKNLKKKSNKLKTLNYMKRRKKIKFLKTKLTRKCEIFKFEKNLIKL